MRAKYKLLGSAETSEEIFKMIIEKFYCGSDIRFEGTIGLYSLKNSKGETLEGMRVIRKAGRYRFEMEIK